MKIETFIKNEKEKYYKEVIQNKKKGVNLDKLERLSRQHERNCIEFIDKNCQDGYSAKCKYEVMARKELQWIDDTVFGCFNLDGN